MIMRFRSGLAADVDATALAPMLLRERLKLLIGDYQASTVSRHAISVRAASVGHA